MIDIDDESNELNGMNEQLVGVISGMDDYEYFMTLVAMRRAIERIKNIREVLDND